MSDAADSHRLALPAGYQLEEYRIESVLGKGGFGITYLARDTNLHHRVAIKEMLPDGIATRVGGQTVVAQTEALEDNFRWALARFIDEARVLASLSHPNIVPVLRLIESNGTAYMIMAFVEGESLTQWFLKHPKPSEDELKSVLMPLLEGVEYLHKRKLLHRDIKPDNIFLTKGESKPVLLDFGNVRQELGRTMTMTTVVSDGYSPFEQYQQRANQGGFTDLYALAAVMARGVLGAKPPNAPDRVSDDDLFPPLARVAKGRYSTAFLEALDRCLAVWSKDRPQSVAEFRELMSGVARPSDKAGAPPVKRAFDDGDKTGKAVPHQDVTGGTSRANATLWKVLGGVAGVGLMGLIIYFSSPKPQPKPDPKPDPGTKKLSITDSDKKGEPIRSDDPLQAKKKLTPEEPAKQIGRWVVDVNGGSGSDGTDLATVLAKVGDGDSVTVRPGAYTCGITLTKAVKITGESKDGAPVIVGSGGDACFTIKSRGVVLENLQIRYQPAAASSMTPAVGVAGGAEAQLIGCRIQSGSNVGVIGGGNAEITAIKCLFTGNGGGAFQLGEQSRGRLTDCQFTGNVAGVVALGGAAAELKSCTFQNNTLPNGKGVVIGVSGEKARVIAEDCLFSGNPRGLEATDAGSLVLTRCTLTDNGVATGQAGTTLGLVAANERGHATLTDVTFKTNRQGVVALKSGTVELTGCHFTGNGVKSAVAPFSLYCENVAVSGSGSSATLRHCDFAEAQLHAVDVIDGGSVTIEDTEVISSSSSGLIIGVAGTAACRGEVRRSHFNRNLNGIVVGAGSSVTIEEGECRQNKVGLIAQDTGTRVQLNRLAASDNLELGLWVHSGADLTAFACNLENNPRGAQVGWPDNASKRASLALDNSTIGPAPLFDAQACQQSMLNIKNCVFNGGGRPRLVKERGAAINIDPPIDFDSKPGKMQPAIADGDTPHKSSPSQRQRPSTGGMDTNTPPSIKKTIDELNKLKRLFR